MSFVDLETFRGLLEWGEQVGENGRSRLAPVECEALRKLIRGERMRRRELLIAQMPRPIVGRTYRFNDELDRWEVAEACKCKVCCVARRGLRLKDCCPEGSTHGAACHCSGARI